MTSALVVGLGSIGRRHARNWSALGLGDVWVCRATGAPRPEPLGVPVREFRDLEAALAAGPDVVLVTNPTSVHLSTARLAVQANAHVFVEKPLSHTLAGVADLLADAAARQRVVMVGYHLRFHPGLRRLKDLLAAGAIGSVVSARASAGEYLPDWHPWEDYRQGYAARRDLGGGPVLTFSHELDALCWLLGAPSRVVGLTGHASRLEIDTEDTADLVMQFGGGMIGSVHVDYVRRPPERVIELVGEAGVLRWEYAANRVLGYAPATRQWRVEEGDPRFDRNDMYRAEVRHLAACIRGDAQPLVDGVRGAAILGVALAGLDAARTGQAVDLQSADEPLATWLTSL